MVAYGLHLRPGHRTRRHFLSRPLHALCLRVPAREGGKAVQEEDQAQGVAAEGPHGAVQQLDAQMCHGGIICLCFSSRLPLPQDGDEESLQLLPLLLRLPHAPLLHPLAQQGSSVERHSSLGHDVGRDECAHSDDRGSHHLVAAPGHRSHLPRFLVSPGRSRDSASFLDEALAARLPDCDDPDCLLSLLLDRGMCLVLSFVPRDAA
mmetsp:Transcript_39756/g.77839  ORF Transcript_39756/g.77839 Transcript_39756/m.77839 type:complete len:206 (-) Transcript_39756:1741-2358(-)